MTSVARQKVVAELTEALVPQTVALEAPRAEALEAPQTVGVASEAAPAEGGLRYRLAQLEERVLALEGLM